MAFILLKKRSQIFTVSSQLEGEMSDSRCSITSWFRKSEGGHALRKSEPTVWDVRAAPGSTSLGIASSRVTGAPSPDQRLLPDGRGFRTILRAVIDVRAALSQRFPPLVQDRSS